MKIVNFVLLFMLFKFSLYSQSIKYNFQFPKRDSLAFRPYKLAGTYKGGTLSFNVQFEKDATAANNGMAPAVSAFTDQNFKPNGLRGVKFQFKFYDSNSALLVDTSTAFHVDLYDGLAIPPLTDIIRFKYQIPEPYKLVFICSFYDRPSLHSQTNQVFVWNSRYEIQMFKYNEDYTQSTCTRDTAWMAKW